MTIFSFFLQQNAKNRQEEKVKNDKCLFSLLKKVGKYICSTGKYIFFCTLFFLPADTKYKACVVKNKTTLQVYQNLLAVCYTGIPAP